MRTKLFLSIFLCLVLIACSTQEIILPDLVVTNPVQFTKFNKERIAISTEDSISVKIINHRNLITYNRYRKLKHHEITNYVFAKDSLLIDDPYFKARLKIGMISQIKFKGLWDNEAGFISEKEINNNRPLDYRKPFGFILGGILGLIGIPIAIGALASTFGGVGNEYTGWAIVGISGITGCILGAIKGADLLEEEAPSIDPIVENIRVLRMQKKFSGKRL